MQEQTPIICTLDAAEKLERSSEWQELVRTAVEERGECEGGFVLTLRAGAQILSDVQTLVDAEKTCCRWIDFELPQGDRLTLRITARSPEGVAVIKEMLGL